MRGKKLRLRFAHFCCGFFIATLGNERLDQVRSRAWNRNVAGRKHTHADRQRLAQILFARGRIAEPDFRVAQVPQRVGRVLVLVAECLAAQVERFGERGPSAGSVLEAATGGVLRE